MEQLMSTDRMILGIIVLVLPVIGFLGLLTFFIFRKKSRKKLKEQVSTAPVSARLEDRLVKARGGWVNRLSQLIKSHTEIDEKLYQELEETLITADIGVTTTQVLLERVRQSISKQDRKDVEVVKSQLQHEISNILSKNQIENSIENENGFLDTKGKKPLVVMIVGVNGVGKTTTIGKLASIFVKSGKKVLLAAGDTFRAAAVEQLEIWGERAGVEVISQKDGKDPSAVAFDAASAANARDIDVLIVDTAGRFHTKVNLMEELKKVSRTLAKKIPDAPHEIWLVLDATTGQNAVQQAKKFFEELEERVTGIILTKLDGTAKGGVLISLAEELNIPIRYIGVGEQAEDLLAIIAQITRRLYK